MNRPFDPVSISAFPHGKQEEAWRATLRSLSIVCRHRDEAGFDFGEIATRSVPTGATATLLRSTAQDFAGLPETQG